MKTLARIAVAFTAVASCAAFAQTDSDSARRERNMNEVLAKHHVRLDSTSGDTQAMPSEHRTLNERTHHVAERTRSTTHKVAQSTRDFTHRQAEKMRDFSARQDARYSNGDHTAKSAEHAPS
jgi:hypothetical protein